MFLSSKLNGYYPELSGKYYCFRHKIIDTDFGEASVAVKISTPNIPIEIGMAVIQEYSKRKLNVAANFALFLVWWQKQNTFITVHELIEANKKYNPLFPRYEKDLQKYLMLL
jgi:hypothetical protein